nr:hypothetical protein [Tanacetum cinerariifolium]
MWYIKRILSPKTSGAKHIDMFIVTYIGEHYHPIPTHRTNRNSLAGDDKPHLISVVKTDEDQDENQNVATVDSQVNKILNVPCPLASTKWGFVSQHFSAHPPINMRCHADLGRINVYMNPYYGGGSYMRPQARSHHYFMWSFSQDIASDVTVNAGGVSFSLHK